MNAATSRMTSLPQRAHGPQDLFAGKPECGRPPPLARWRRGDVRNGLAQLGDVDALASEPALTVWELLTIAQSGWLTSWAIEAASSPIAVHARRERVARASSETPLRLAACGHVDHEAAQHGGRPASATTLTMSWIQTVRPSAASIR